MRQTLILDGLEEEEDREEVASFLKNLFQESQLYTMVVINHTDGITFWQQADGDGFDRIILPDYAKLTVNKTDINGRNHHLEIAQLLSSLPIFDAAFAGWHLDMIRTYFAPGVVIWSSSGMMSARAARRSENSAIQAERNTMVRA